MKVTTAKLQKLTVNFAMNLNGKIAVQNVQMFKDMTYQGWECDVFAIDKNLFSWEYEIKSSRMDFIADQDKEQKLWNTENGNGASYFHYVTDKGVCDLDDIPEFAGWIEINKFGKLHVIKQGMMLHNNRVDPLIWEELAMKLFYKHTNFGI